MEERRAAAPVMVRQPVQQQACASATGPFDALALKAGYKGTDLTITAASAIYALHGSDGIEDPVLSDLGWLRTLLRECQDQRVFEALVGDSDDPDATCLMLRSVEEMYRRAAKLVGYRTDLFPHELTPPDEMPF